MSEERRAEEDKGGGAEVEERRVMNRGNKNNERRMGARAPDRQAGGPASQAQSGAGGPGSRSELSTLSAWVSSAEITHNMNHL